METRLRIQKWGNGLGISIPSVIVTGLSLKEGLYVSVQESNNKIIIEPVKTSVSYSLTDMLCEITDDNLHRCIETGAPTGNEIW